MSHEFASKHPPAEDPPEILTVEEAAALIRINRKTLYEQIQRERPAWALRFGRSIRIGRTALLEAFRGNRGALRSATR